MNRKIEITRRELLAHVKPYEVLHCLWPRQLRRKGQYYTVRHLQQQALFRTQLLVIPWGAP